MTDASRARRLENKTAVTLEAAGDVGSPVAKELAAHGAQVFLSGRTKARFQQLAQAISSRGETVRAAEVDALDECRADTPTRETARRLSDDVMTELVNAAAGLRRRPTAAGFEY
jgi:3-oxoacyl-[acyl-carrier protein] reductase